MKSLTFTNKDYARRRTRLMNSMQPGAVAIVPAATEQRRSRDINYPFRQDSDFYYLTGFAEPDALLVLIPGRAYGQTILFCREKDPELELRDGPVLAPEGAAQKLAVDDAFPIADLADILPGLLEGRSRIYMSLGEHPDWDARVFAYLRGLGTVPGSPNTPADQITSLQPLLHEQRLSKCAKELAVMQRAADISVAAIRAATLACGPGKNEADLEAELIATYLRQGASGDAYPSIVAGGKNACILHYTNNNASLFDGDLVLIDAGCEYQHYAADIARTFPVSGTFSRPQRDLYSVVLAANKAGIEACQPGNTVADPHDAALAVMVAGLIDLGILKGSVEQVMEQSLYKQFCPYRCSHWLGMDVHDVGEYMLGDVWRTLAPGHVLTVEPGIYIPADACAQKVPQEYCGLGIRIEDDVAITDVGCQVLSAAAVKEISHIEALLAGEAA